MTYEAAFKQIITAGWAVKSDGHVESPSGFFAQVEIPGHWAELRDMLDAVELTREDVDGLEQGWYVTKENSDGILTYWYLGRGSRGESTSWRLFDTYMTTFTEWELT